MLKQTVAFVLFLLSLTSADVLWHSSTDYVTGDSRLTLTKRSTQGPFAQVVSNTAADLQWIYIGLQVDAPLSIQSVLVCYRLMNVNSFISQVRITSMSDPSAAYVIHDDGNDLLSTTDTCYNSTVGGYQPTGSLTMALRLSFGADLSPIRLGAVGVYVTKVASTERTLWLSPVRWSEGDTTITIAQPNTGFPWAQVTVTSPGDLKWITSGFPIATTSSITGVIVCYSTSDPTSFVSQIRLAQMTTPNQATVRLDDGTDLTSTTPVCVRTNTTGIAPTGGIVLSLRLFFAATTHVIRLGAFGIVYRTQSVPQDLVWLSSPNWVAQDSFLTITPPSVSSVATRIVSSQAGDLQWVFLGFPTPFSPVTVSGVTLCYRVTSPTSYISQIRITADLLPSSSQVVLDDGTDLVSTNATCFTSGLSTVVNTGFTFALRLNFANPSQTIFLGAIAMTITYPTTTTTTSAAATTTTAAATTTTTTAAATTTTTTAAATTTTTAAATTTTTAATTTTTAAATATSTGAGTSDTSTSASATSDASTSAGTSATSASTVFSTLAATSSGNSTEGVSASSGLNVGYALICLVLCLLFLQH